MEEPAPQQEQQSLNDQPSQNDKKDQRYKFSKREIGLMVVIGVAIIGVTLFAWQTDRNKKSSINSFEECAAAGNPIMESYPEQCAANGQTFTRELTEKEKNELEAANAPKSEKITDLPENEQIRLIAQSDISKLDQRFSDAFKKYMQQVLEDNTPDNDGCAVLYTIKRVSNVNISGSVGGGSVNNPDSDECSDGAAAAFWYDKEGSWNVLKMQDMPGCSELDETTIYAEFISSCYDPNSETMEASNPNGSIDDI